jgi:hypothetical protein
MSRRAFKLVLFLLAGAIINVCTAILCAAYGTSSKDGLPLVDESESIVKERYPVPDDWLAKRPSSLCTTGTVGVRITRTTYHSWIDRFTSWFGCMIQITAGWPTGCLQGELFRTVRDRESQVEIRDVVCVGDDRVTPSNQAVFHKGIVPSIGAVPCRPLWPGFAINTMFYAAIVWMLFAVPGAVRRQVRIKRGKCASCGYSLREIVSEKCPECGRIVSK